MWSPRGFMENPCQPALDAASSVSPAIRSRTSSTVKTCQPHISGQVMVPSGYFLSGVDQISAQVQIAGNQEAAVGIMAVVDDKQDTGTRIVVPESHLAVGDPMDGLTTVAPDADAPVFPVPPDGMAIPGAKVEMDPALVADPLRIGVPIWPFHRGGGRPTCGKQDDSCHDGLQ